MDGRKGRSSTRYSNGPSSEHAWQPLETQGARRAQMIAYLLHMLLEALIPMPLPRRKGGTRRGHRFAQPVVGHFSSFSVECLSTETRTDLRKFGHRPRVGRDPQAGWETRALTIRAGIRGGSDACRLRPDGSGRGDRPCRCSSGCSRLKHKAEFVRVLEIVQILRYGAVSSPNTRK